MRSEKPFYRSFGTLVLTRYDHVQAALKHPDLSVAGIPQTLQDLAAQWRVAIPPAVARSLDSLLVFMDEPEHASLRRAMMRVFSIKVLTLLREQLRMQIDAMFDAKAGQSRIDLLNEIAAPLWPKVMGRWLGLSADECDVLAVQGKAMRHLLDPSVITRQELVDMVAAIATLYQLFFDAFHRPRSAIDDNLYNHFEASFGTDGGSVDVDQVVIACINSLLGGTETTQALIGNLFLLLGRHPAVVDDIKVNPALIKAAVLETLRLEPPLQMTRRVALGDTRIADEPILRGQPILLCLAAANRDPDKIATPDVFDIHRKGPQHLSFGYGIHICLGMALAQLQAEVMLEVFLARFGVIELAEEVPRWQTHSLIVRSLMGLYLQTPVTANV